MINKINAAKKNIKNKLQKRLIMTLLVKNEEDIVEECIEFHLRCGVDFIIATNNNSTDKTREILLKYQQQGLLEIIDETDDTFNQVVWVDRMIKIAKTKYKADWIINVDADEFWFSRYGNLKLSLPDNKNIHGIFVAGIHINPQPAGEKFKIRENMKGVMHSRFKCLHSAKGYQKIGGGNHDVRLKLFHRKMIASNDIVVFHFWVRSLEQYEKKIVNTFKSIENGLKQGKNDISFGEHIRYHYKLYQEGKMLEIYNSIVNADGEDYFIDNRLYDFIQNNYKNPEQTLALKYFVNNYPARSSIKYKMQKFILSCQRRKQEIVKTLKKITQPK